MFSGTAPIFQTALVLSSPEIAAQSSEGYQSHRPHLSPYYIRHDGRLRPAYYMISVSIISFIALTFGVPYCERKRIEIEKISRTGAAIKSTFDAEVVTKSDAPLDMMPPVDNKAGHKEAEANYDKQTITV